MKVKNIGDFYYISSFVNLHVHNIIYGSRSNSFGVTVKQQHFADLILKIKVSDICNLADV